MLNAIATTIETQANAIAAAAREEGANESGGAYLKFSKGHYFLATEEVAPGREYIAHVAQWIRGWIKFRGGALIERRVGKVADGFIVPAREDLDDQDESRWEIDPRGGPKDPWTMQSYLPLEDVETGEIVVFVSGSVGGRGAISTLCARAARHMAEMGQPRIKLAVESYKHKSFGRIDKPSFPIVGWTGDVKPADSEVVANSDGFSDAIPF